MSKLIYKAQEKPYSQDLNDLIEEDIEKGGVGSGKKGHQTPKRGPDGKLTEAYKQSKIAEIEANVQRNKMRATNQISQALANRKTGTDNSPAAQGAHAAGNESIKKGGVGSGQKGHTTQKEATPSKPVPANSQESKLMAQLDDWFDAYDRDKVEAESLIDWGKTYLTSAKALPESVNKKKLIETCERFIQYGRERKMDQEDND